MHDCCPVQLTSHEHALPQFTVWQLSRPLHVTLHGPLPHVTVLHVWSLPQVTEHDSEPTQLTPLRQSLLPAHSTVHAKPAGQSIVPFVQLVWLQLMSQVFSPAAFVLQLEQLPGHWPLLPVGASMPFPVPSTTQNPPTHVRPLLQSAFLMHANASLRLSIEQPRPKAEASAKQTRSAGFKAVLRS